MTGPSPERKGAIPRLNLGYTDVVDMNLSPTDHCLHTDMRTYASSPNSLYMYEQEKFDMQNSYQAFCDSCPVKCEQFDLKPEMEEDMLNCTPATTMCGAMDECLSPTSTWEHPRDGGLLKMEDIFQVDRRDGTLGPTLAELNCDESLGLFDDIESMIKKDFGMYQNDSWCAEQDKKPVLPSGGSSTHHQTLGLIPLMNSSSDAGNQSTAETSRSSPCHTVTSKSAMQPDSADELPANPKVPKRGQHTSLHKLLTQAPSAASTSATVAPPMRSPACEAHKRSWTPAGNEMIQGQALDQKWEEIRQFIHDEPATFHTQLKKPKLESQEHGQVFKQEEEAESNEEDGFDSEQEESDVDDDHNWSSEAESVDSNDSGHSRDIEGAGGSYRSKKDARYFWQYNVQSKGPKGKRLCVSLDDHDPHVLNDFEDPVFDPDLKTDFKHMGKARRGDGNDIAPSPRKLFQIGNELKKLNRVINDLTPVSELPVNVRPRSRREKNKLASRACRMKKKAQHEANKVKLYGLEQEHQSLMLVISSMKEEVKRKANGGTSKIGETMVARLEKLMRTHLTCTVADKADEYICSVLKKYTGHDDADWLMI